ncbi:MAG: phosphopantothenoylcysteine decarboxylase [Opitutus sp.]
MNLLVTSGATREPIDAVRFISNISSGRTGAALTEHLRRHGHGVTLLHGEGAALPTGAIKRLSFSSTDDLRTLLQRTLETGNFDGVIMAAAVSDYRPAAVQSGKLASASEHLELRLVRNAKILPLLKTFSPRPLHVTGFKLTAGADENEIALAVDAQFSAGGVDAVVHNDLAAIRSAADHPFALYATAHQPPVHLSGVEALSNALNELYSR